MRDGLQSSMRVGIVHFMAFPGAKSGVGPIGDWVRKIAEDAFFGAIEIAPVKESMEKGKVASILATSGLAVGFGAHPVILGGSLDLNHSEPQERQRALGAMRLCIDEATMYGSESVTVLSGKDVDACDRSAATHRLIDSLVQLSEYAGERGLRLQLETFDRAVDKRCLIGPSCEAAGVAEAVRRRCPNFGLTVDLSHLPLLGESPAVAMAALGKYVTHVHIGNCVVRDSGHPYYGDNHPRFGAPGGEVGVPELAEFLRALVKVGYLGNPASTGRPLPIVAFEVQPMPGETSELVIANAKRTLQQAWAMA